MAPTTDPPPANAGASFKPIEIIDGALEAGVLFICDHASNVLPPEVGDLGLSPGQMERHIAYDIGAAAMTRHLARRFGAPAVLTTFSRLLIDPNRGADDPTLLMRLSDGAVVAGNARVGADEVERRRKTYWQPYRDAVAAAVDAMLAAGKVPAIVSMHSFTPFWKATPRPWHIGILWDSDPRLVAGLIQGLRAEGDLVVGDNEPYDGALHGDTLHAQATERGLANVLIEVRQDLIARQVEAEAWAERLAGLLEPLLEAPEVHRVEHHASRAG